jgi:hypothetical protein
MLFETGKDGGPIHTLRIYIGFTLRPPICTATPLRVAEREGPAPKAWEGDVVSRVPVLCPFNLEFSIMSLESAS